MAPGKSNVKEFPDPLYFDSYIVEDNYKAAMVAYVVCSRASLDCGTVPYRWGTR